MSVKAGCWRTTLAGLFYNPHSTQWTNWISAQTLRTGHPLLPHSRLFLSFFSYPFSLFLSLSLSMSLSNSLSQYSCILKRKFILNSVLSATYYTQGIGLSIFYLIIIVFHPGLKQALVIQDCNSLWAYFWYVTLLFSIFFVYQIVLNFLSDASDQYYLRIRAIHTKKNTYL